MSIPIPSTNGTCLITGASSGIGSEFARQMAERGYNVTLAARRGDRLTELAAEIERDHGVRAHAVTCDVTDATQRAQMLADVAERGEQVEILINNAGAGTDGLFWEHSTEEQVAQIELNAVSLTALTHMVLPAMIERGAGAILNVASTAGMQPMPRQSVYAATKSFVISFSQGVNKELQGTGVSITVLCPGPTKTEFFGERQAGLEKDSPGFVWQTAADCAKAGLDGMFKRKRVVVPKALNKVGAVSAKHSPTSMTLEVLDRFWPIGK
ncbi:MAG: SDR family NAD(P)-dependent oxidoreductase [Solirubrobacterales bacterium]